MPDRISLSPQHGGVARLRRRLGALEEAQNPGKSLLPFGIPQKLVHGTNDASVPFEISRQYVSTAVARGDNAELIPLEGAGHFELVDPGTKEFERVQEIVLTLV